MSAPNPYAAPTADINAPIVPGADNLPLAGRGARLGAVLLDLVVYFGAGAVMLVGFGLILAASRGAERPGSGAIGAVGVGALLVLGVFIFQMYRLATTGQTLGKKWLNIRVVKMDDAAVTFSSAVMLRTILPLLLRSVPYIGIVFGLVDTFFIFREDRRCIHDLIANTKVVEVADL